MKFDYICSKPYRGKLIKNKKMQKEIAQNRTTPLTATIYDYNTLRNPIIKMEVYFLSDIICNLE